MPKYRVLQKIHIGGSDSALNKNEVIGYDAKTLVREDGKEVPLSSPDALKGAIALGWIVPEASPETTFRPKPAGIEVRSAVSTSENRELVQLSTVSSEERNVGNRTVVREASAQGSNTPSGEGRVIGNVKGATEARERVVQREDRIVRAVATGDVQEAIVGEDLQDLLPDATSSERPEPGVYKEKPTQNSHNIEIPKTPEARVELLAGWVRNRDSHIPPIQLRGLVSEVLGQLVEARDTTKAEGDAIIHLSPEDATISWDFTAHWKTRQKAVEQYWDDKGALTWIAKNESSKGVLKVVNARLSQLA